MIYITSDTHFFHKRLIEWGIRQPEDEAKILDSWLELGKGDTLIFLGDFQLGKDTGMSRNESMASILSSYLEGVNKIFIKGNHDKESTQKYYNLGWNCVCESMVMYFNHRTVEFTHNPLNLGEFDDINIHGHRHGKYGYINKNIDGTFNVDMSVENTNMKPLPLDTIVKLCI